MSEKEKQTRAGLILVLEAAKSMVATVPGASTTLKEAGKAIGVLIEQLSVSDEGPDAC